MNNVQYNSPSKVMSDVFCHLLIKRKDDKHALTEDHHVLACFLLFSVFVQSILESFLNHSFYLYLTFVTVYVA